MDDDENENETTEFEVQTDIVTLIENVKCQKNNIPSVKQALLTLAGICSSGTAQDYFCDVGGIKVIQKLLYNQSCPVAVVPAALFCLACVVKENVSSQRVALTEKLMSFLHELLSHGRSNGQMIQSAAFLIACLVAGNSKGQALCWQTGCLQDLINLLRSSPVNESEDENLWSSITSAIGVSVNNPQNEENQRMCCSVLPHVLKVISRGKRTHVDKHALGLINLVVANNAANQERMRNCDGVGALMRYVQSCHASETRGPRPALQICALSALDACIADHKAAGLQAATLGLVHLLIELLAESGVEDGHLHTLVLTLAHVLESATHYCGLLRQGRGHEVLVRFLSESEDDELLKAVKYVLSLCRTHEAEQNRAELIDSPKKSHRNVYSDSNSFFKADGRGLGSESTVASNTSGRSPRILASPNKYLSELQNLYKVCHRQMASLTQDSDVLEAAIGQQGRGDGPNMQINNQRKEAYAASVGASPYPRPGTSHRQNDLWDHTPQVLAENLDRLDSLDKLTSFMRNGQEIYSKDVGPAYSNMFPMRRFSPAAVNHNNLPKSTVLLNRMQWSGDPPGFLHPRSSTLPHSENGDDYCRREDSNTDILSGQRYPQEKNTSHQADSLIHLLRGGTFQSSVTSHGLVPDLTMSCNEVHKDFPNEAARTGDVSSPPSVSRQVEVSDVILQQQEVRTNVSQSSVHSDRVEEQCSMNKQSANSSNEAVGQMVAFQQTSLNLLQELQEKVSRCSTFLATVFKGNKDASVDKDRSGSVSHCFAEKFRGQSPVPHSHASHCNAVQVNRVNDDAEVIEIHDDDGDLTRSVEEGSRYDCPVLLDDVAVESEITFLTHNTLTMKEEDTFCPTVGFYSPQKTKSPGRYFQNNCDGDKPTLLVPSSCMNPVLEICTEKSECSSDKDQAEDVFVKPLPPALSYPRTCGSSSVRRRPRLPSLPRSRHGAGPEPNSDVGRSSLTPTIRYVRRTPTLSRSSATKTISEPMDQLPPPRPPSPVGSEFDSKIETMAQEGRRYSPFFSSSKNGGRSSIDYLRPTKHSDWFKVSKIRPTKNSEMSTADKFRAAKNSDKSPADTFRDVKDREMSTTDKFRPIKNSEISTADKFRPIKDSEMSTADKFRAGKESDRSSEDRFRATRESDRSSEDRFRPNKENNKPTADCFRSSQNFDRSVADNCIPADGEYKNVSRVSRDDLCTPSYRRTTLESLPVCQSVDRARPLLKIAQRREMEHPEAMIVSTSGGFKGQGRSQDTQCPGCGVGADLNSWTYNISIETSAYTCDHHRRIRQLERQYIKANAKKSYGCHYMNATRATNKHRLHHTVKEGKGVYDFSSDSNQELSSPEHDISMTSVLAAVGRRKHMDRRPRMDYSEQEVAYLLHGVETMGKFWQQILCSFPFHPSRTAVDLKDKYKRIMAEGGCPQSPRTTQTSHVPFSMCEIRRLRRGVRTLGYNWKAILCNSQFMPGRTPADLRNKWRSLNKVTA